MQGLDTDEIAEQCVVAPATVKTHIRNMYQKTGTHSRVALVDWGRRDLGHVIADLNRIAHPEAE